MSRVNQQSEQSKEENREHKNKQSSKHSTKQYAPTAQQTTTTRTPATENSRQLTGRFPDCLSTWQDVLTHQRIALGFTCF